LVWNSNPRLARWKILAVASDQWRVFQARGSPDDGIGQFELMFLAKRNEVQLIFGPFVV
jgi:hypothetical protein